MDVGQIIRDVRAERDAKIAEVARPYDEVLASLERLVTTSAEVTPSAAPAPARGHSEPTTRRVRRSTHDLRPRGPEAVRRVLFETGRELTVREINDELTVRGWSPDTNDPINVVSTNASRAADRFSNVDRRKSPSGGYLYWFQHEEEDADESTDPTSDHGNVIAMAPPLTHDQRGHNDRTDPAEGVMT